MDGQVIAMTEEGADIWWHSGSLTRWVGGFVSVWQDMLAVCRY